MRRRVKCFSLAVVILGLVGCGPTVEERYGITPTPKVTKNQTTIPKTFLPVPKPRFKCEDGTTSNAKHRQGACSGHGGVK